MPPTADHILYDVLAAVTTLVAVAYLLRLLVVRLRRARPDLSIGRPVAAALVLRVAAAASVSLTAVGPALRGGDEVAFLGAARELSEAPLGSPAWGEALTGELYNFVFAVQLFAFEPPELALRITQAGIAVAAITLLAAAVWELAGPRAAVIAAWLLAFEPANVFFSTILHKEPNMMLAGALVAFGGAALWKRGELRSLVPIGAGCLIAVATRPYAGWFLIAAAAAITLHAGLRAKRTKAAQTLALLAVVVLVGALSAPIVWEASTEDNLTELQSSQEANTTDEDANLALEEVDFSTREQVILNLPQRIRDVLLRPYPWQLANTSQQFGLIGTLIAIMLLALLLRELIRNRGRIMRQAGPLLYVSLFLLIAYALSAGNAGTAFRYRTHLVAVGLGALTVFWLTSHREARRRQPNVPCLEVRHARSVA